MAKQPKGKEHPKLGSIRMVDPGELQPHKLNKKFFSRMDDITFSRLKADIKQNGVRNPIIITADSEIVAGSERVRAAKQLKIETVPVTVRKFKDEAEIAAAVISDNVLRRHLTKTEIAKAGKELEEMVRTSGEVEPPGRKKGAKVEKIEKGKKKKKKKSSGAKYVKTGKTAAEKAASAMGISASQYHQVKRAVKVPPEVLKHLDAEEISLELAEQIAALPNSAKKEAAGICKEESLKGADLKKELKSLIKKQTPTDDKNRKAVKRAVAQADRLLAVVDEDLAPIWADLSKAQQTEFRTILNMVIQRVRTMKEAVEGAESSGKKRKKKVKK